MKSPTRILKESLMVLYLVAIHTLAALFIYENHIRDFLSSENVPVEIVKDPTEKIDVPTPQPIPSVSVFETPETAATGENQTNSAEFSAVLMIPVAGIKREQLQDTFQDSRSESRAHNGIDIIAPPGTPVLAASDGEIAKFFDSERGGITIYQYSSDKRFVYYYAHLQKRAANLNEKDFVKKGTIIGYVGDTGNSGAGNYHLHFSVSILNDSNKIFDATDINPYPLLKNGIESP